LLKKMVKTKDIRSKILFTLMLLFLYRVGTFIPVPGVNTSLIDANSSLFGFMNTFSGGALQNFSLFAVGIMPYITASIIIQLLQLDVVPTLTQWAKEGEHGQKKIKLTTRILTVILGFIQSLGLAYGFHNMYGIVNDPGVPSYLLIATVLTVGTVILMVFGELITNKGFGNGISVLIFAGIVAGFPNSINLFLQTEFTNNTDMIFLSVVKVILILFVLLAVTLFVVFFQQSVRKIPVQYAKKAVGSKMMGAQKSHLPFKINTAGVIPVIFAVSLFIFPSTMARFMEPSDTTLWIISTFDYTKPFGMLLYVIMIAFFTFFYAFVQTNPEKLADDLKKQNGSVPGIRPGKDTERYLSRILKRLTVVGVLFLAFIAVLPMLIGMFTNLPTQIQIGGISLLIVENVALETYKQIKSKILGGEYQGFIRE